MASPADRVGVCGNSIAEVTWTRSWEPDATASVRGHIPSTMISTATAQKGS